MTREEAIHVLEDGRWWDFIPECNINKEMYDALVELHKALDMAIAAIRAQQEQESKPLNGWISVKDRLPDTCGFPCLLCGENAFGQICVFAGFTGYMERGKFEWHSNQKDIDIDVWTITHWMPMPFFPPEVVI